MFCAAPPACIKDINLYEKSQICSFISRKGQVIFTSLLKQKENSAFVGDYIQLWINTYLVFFYCTRMVDLRLTAEFNAVSIFIVMK